MLISQAPLFHSSGLIVLDNNIHLLRNLPKDLLAFGFIEGQCYSPLTPVKGQIIRTGLQFIWNIQVGWYMPTQFTHYRGIYLDRLCTQVYQDSPCYWTSLGSSGLQHLNPSKRPAGIRYSLFIKFFFSHMRFSLFLCPIQGLPLIPLRPFSKKERIVRGLILILSGGKVNEILEMEVSQKFLQPSIIPFKISPLHFPIF